MRKTHREVKQLAKDCPASYSWSLALNPRKFVYPIQYNYKTTNYKKWPNVILTVVKLWNSIWGYGIREDYPPWLPLFRIILKILDYALWQAKYKTKEKELILLTGVIIVSVEKKLNIKIIRIITEYKDTIQTSIISIIIKV